MGDLHRIAGLGHHCLYPDPGDARVGEWRQHKTESEPVKKMRPQNTALVAIKSSLHTHGWAIVRLHHGFTLQLFVNPGHVCLPNLLSQFEEVFFLRSRVSGQFIAPALTTPNTATTVKIINLQLAFVMAVRVCTAYFFSVLHSVVYGTVEASEGAFTLVFQPHFLLHTASSAIGP